MVQHLIYKNQPPRSWATLVDTNASYGASIPTARPQVFEYAYRGDEARCFSINIQLRYAYEGCPIIIPDGTSRPEDAISTHAQTARPGSRAPHIRSKEDGGRTTGLKEFVLLRFRRAGTILAK